MIEKLFLAIGLVLAFEGASMPFFRHFYVLLSNKSMLSVMPSPQWWAGRALLIGVVLVWMLG